MREILFRGKRMDGKGWVEGWYYQLKRPEKIVHYIVENPLPKLVGVKEYEVCPTTVGQFTGLLDKNGKKIFEGDIVNHGYENDYGEFYDHYKVIYSNTNTCFVLESIYPCNPIKRLTKNNVKSQHTEVIGNIYDLHGSNCRQIRTARRHRRHSTWTCPAAWVISESSAGGYGKGH